MYFVETLKSLSFVNSKKNWKKLDVKKKPMLLLDAKDLNLIKLVSSYLDELLFTNLLQSSFGYEIKSVLWEYCAFNVYFVLTDQKSKLESQNIFQLFGPADLRFDKRELSTIKDLNVNLTERFGI